MRYYRLSLHGCNSKSPFAADKNEHSRKVAPGSRQRSMPVLHLNCCDWRDVHRSVYATLRGTLSVPKCCWSGRIAISPLPTPPLEERTCLFSNDLWNLYRGTLLFEYGLCWAQLGSFVTMMSAVRGYVRERIGSEPNARGSFLARGRFLFWGQKL